MNDKEQRELDWRAHWRFIFNVIDSVPRMQREITIWPKENVWQASGLTRLAYDIKTLAPTNEVNVTKEPDRVVLKNGFIEYQTDLDEDIRVLAQAAGRWVPETLEGISEVVGGENIFIRADISLPDDNPLSEYPVFFFPQEDPRGIYLGEIIDPHDSSRRIKWNISNQFYKSQGAFRLEEFQGRHGLRVRQVQERSQDLFNFHVDSMTLDISTTSATHSFLSGLQTFYLGYRKDRKERFTGAIYHLEFDPNNSCAGCPKPTITEPNREESN